MKKEQYKKQQNHHGIRTNGLRRSEIKSNSNLEKKKNGNITKPMEIWKENIGTTRTSLLKIRGKKSFKNKQVDN